MKEERQQMILEALQNSRKVTVSHLSDLFGASQVTIRRDLNELARSGKLRRTHRGALLVAPGPPQPPVVQRMVQATELKEAIGRAAARLINDGESVFFSSGSTIVYVARHLAEHKNLTVVTNAINVAMELATNENFTVVMMGGMLRRSELSLSGHIAELCLKEIRVDKVIMGMAAISLEAVLTNDYLPEVMTDRAIIQMAPELIIVADHTKFGMVQSAYLAPVERINTLVTDAGANPEVLSDFRKLGIRVIVAGEDV
jgi:DeoR/GlpR family transcriptional regulator of sugar metabolism